MPYNDEQINVSALDELNNAYENELAGTRVKVLSLPDFSEALQLLGDIFTILQRIKPEYKNNKQFEEIDSQITLAHKLLNDFCLHQTGTCPQYLPTENLDIKKIQLLLKMLISKLFKIHIEDQDKQKILHYILDILLEVLILIA